MGVTFQIAFFDDFVCFSKKVTFQVASKLYTTTAYYIYYYNPHKKYIKL